MPLFTCPWQNGDFSAMSARSRENAIELLDEVRSCKDVGGEGQGREREEG